MSKSTGLPWVGRSYKRGDWTIADPVNRALSAANSCLYGVCHAAIIAAGYSPALGFIHTGKMLSFVYDVGDLYKTEISIPTAFQVVSEGTHQLETRARRLCRDAFQQARLLQRILPDIDRALGVAVEDSDFDSDDALPGGLWDPRQGSVPGGLNQADLVPGA